MSDPRQESDVRLCSKQPAKGMIKRCRDPHLDMDQYRMWNSARGKPRTLRELHMAVHVTRVTGDHAEADMLQAMLNEWLGGRQVA